MAEDTETNNASTSYPLFNKQADRKAVNRLLYRIFIIRYIDKFALRSFIQVIVHICIAVILAKMFYYIPLFRIYLSDNSFVTIISSIATASCVFLAVTLAFATFRSQYYTEWTHRNLDRLRCQQEKLESHMKESAKSYPDISHSLVDMYMLFASYIPGQPIDMGVVEKADKDFHEWAAEHIKKDGKKFDFGNINDYESFEKHLWNAHLLSTESRDILTELHVAEVSGRSLNTLIPLATTWAVVLIYALVFAIIVSTGIIFVNANFSILIVPLYLLLFAISALLLDFRGLILSMRMREVGYEMAMASFIKK